MTGIIDVIGTLFIIAGLIYVGARTMRFVIISSDEHTVHHNARIAMSGILVVSLIIILGFQMFVIPAVSAAFIS